MIQTRILQERMMFPNKRACVLIILVICAWAGGLKTACLAQDSSTQVPLGDVVRHQRQERYRSQKAKRTLNDEDIHEHTRQISGDAAVTVIIPNIQITGYIEDMNPNPKPTSEPKLYAWIGSRSLDACSDLDCAKIVYLHELPHLPSMFGATPQILFESESSIDGHPARIAHIEVKHDVKGTMLGEVAFIQTPVVATAATCLYKSDAPDLAAACDEFIGSLRIHMPERFIYVEHNY